MPRLSAAILGITVSLIEPASTWFLPLEMVGLHTASERSNGRARATYCSGSGENPNVGPTNDLERVLEPEDRSSGELRARSPAAFAPFGLPPGSLLSLAP
jgi:hypothetical protein